MRLRQKHLFCRIAPRSHFSAPTSAAECPSPATGDRPEGRPKSEGTLQSGATGRCGRRKHPRRSVTRWSLALLALLALFLGGATWLVHAVLTTTPDISRAERLSVTVLDRHDHLLRAFTTPDGIWRLPAARADVDPRYIAMLIAFEDGRFQRHIGVDPFATLRAVGQLIRNRRIISGASTLTMQVARLLDQPEAPRAIATKLKQAILALALERRYSKDQILGLYLRLAPFGGNLEGVRAASLAYFGKEPRRLSVAERALLVAIPQSPAARRPDRAPKAARRARDRVIARAQEAGVISRAEAEEARREPVPTRRRDFPQLAPHLAEAEAAAAPQRMVHRLTIDRSRQTALETLAREHAERLGPKLSAAVLVVEHATGEVIAHVGSAGYLDQSRLGANDMTNAVRSPGSTLKPFIYGLAFERGLAHPATYIEDRPSRFGRYVPHNFDQDFRGTVTIREALAASLNIPAVKVLAEVGPKRFVSRLRRAGIKAVLPDNAEPSLAVALGGVGLTLHDLAQLYTGLARGGEAIALLHVRSPGSSPRLPPKPIARLLSRSAAWYVSDILKDATPPPSAKGRRIAFKTGTSYGYRDAWAVGHDGRNVVAVWVGRPDASSTPGLTGLGSAAPLLFDAFARLGDHIEPLPAPPRDVMRVRNADLPLPLRRFNASGSSTATDPPVAIAFPPDKSELEIDGGQAQDILLRAEGGALPLTWLVDGMPLLAAPDSREALWKPSGAGFSRIAVVDAAGRADRVTIRWRPTP